MQHEDLDPGPVAASLYRRRPGIAGGRGDDRHLLAALGEHVIEQPADDLEGVVLEGERRPVEQLQQPVIGVEMHQGGDRGMFEFGIGCGGDLAERRLADPGYGERRHESRRDLVIGKGRKPGERRGIEAGPGFRQIQAAVGRETAQQHILEFQRRGLAPCTHIAHSPPLSFDVGHIRRQPPADKRILAGPGPAGDPSSVRRNIPMLRPR